MCNWFWSVSDATRRNALVRAMFLIGLAPASVLANVELFETWENIDALPSGGWVVGSNDGAHAPYINTTAGRPWHCLSMGGGTYSQEGWAYFDSAVYSYNAGLIIQLDAWLACDGWHYTDVDFGLFDGAGTLESNKIVEFGFNKAAQENNILMFLYSNDSNHAEQNTLSGAYTCEQWNTGRIVIRSDGKVEFYVNRTLLWTSTKTVDLGADGNAKFFVRGNEGNGPAYMDNLVISTETPVCNSLAEDWEGIDTLARWRLDGLLGRW